MHVYKCINDFLQILLKIYLYIIESHYLLNCLNRCIFSYTITHFDYKYNWI